jgi:hypothetical protein
MPHRRAELQRPPSSRDLSVVFDISAVLAGIRTGRLVALHSGHCDITATLALEGTDIVTRRAHLDLPGAISLGQGIRLLPAQDYLPGAGPPGTADGERPEGQRSRPAGDARRWWEA